MCVNSIKLMYFRVNKFEVSVNKNIFLVMNSKRCKGATHINNQKFSIMRLLSTQFYCSAGLETNQSCRVQTPCGRKEICAQKNYNSQLVGLLSQLRLAPLEFSFVFPFFSVLASWFPIVASSTIIFFLAFLCCICLVPVCYL